MRRLPLVLFLLIACAGPIQTETFLEGTFEVPENLVSRAVPAEEMRYLLWLPAAYDAAGELPLVVFLHGSGDDDYDSRWLTSYGLPAAVQFADIPQLQPFALLAPQAAQRTAWSTGRQLETVLALVDEVVSQHGLDSDAVALTGLSMGGYGSWHLATLAPHRFSTVASVSGSGYGTTTLPDDLDVCALSSVDIRGYHGSQDMISLPELNVAVIDEWEERCGADIDFRIIDGAGHFATFEQVYRDPDFYDWLLRD